MDAFEFVLYCLGSSMIIVSSGVTYRLIARPATSPPKTGGGSPTPHRFDEPAQDSRQVHDLDARLHSFQKQQFSSPLIKRTLDPAMGPPVRGPMPMRTQVPTQIRKAPSVVDMGNIPIPLKKTDKEGT